MSRRAVLTDAQWERITPLLPSDVAKPGRRFHDHRQFAARADQQLVQIVSSDVLDDFATRFDHTPVGQHRLQADQPVAGGATAEAMRATQIVVEQLADGQSIRAGRIERQPLTRSPQGSL